jgi:YegS/Rv2252/BmrU family lipid kinase
MARPYQQIHVIINPAAGRNEPILNTLNDVFHQYGVNWEVSITHKFGDATRLAQKAAASGVDLVVGYGGDGTQMEIANGVMGSDTPMAILPGGTGNAMAFELDIPRNLRQAAELICQSSHRRQIDLGRIGDHHFMLRTYTGPGKEAVARREEKDRLGVLAYPLASLRIFKGLKPVRYWGTLDGEQVEDEGVMCFIFNAGAWGGVELPKAVDINPGDGLLDVLTINKNINSLRAMASYELNVGKAKMYIHHRQAREIVLEADPPQTVWIDGEAYGKTPITATVIPQAISIVVPEPEPADKS